MTAEYLDYSLFLNFFDAFSLAGVEEIAPDDPMMVELDQMMEMNNQLFYIADVILLDIQFISKRVTNMFGIEPAKVRTGFFLTTTHPDDLRRHHLVRAKLISIAQELYIKKEGRRKQICSCCFGSCITIFRHYRNGRFKKTSEPRFRRNNNHNK